MQAPSGLWRPPHGNFFDAYLVADLLCPNQSCALSCVVGTVPLCSSSIRNRCDLGGWPTPHGSSEAILTRVWRPQCRETQIVDIEGQQIESDEIEVVLPARDGLAQFAEVGQAEFVEHNDLAVNDVTFGADVLGPIHQVATLRRPVMALRVSIRAVLIDDQLREAAVELPIFRRSAISSSRSAQNAPLSPLILTACRPWRNAEPSSWSADIIGRRSSTRLYADNVKSSVLELRQQPLVHLLDIELSLLIKHCRHCSYILKKA